MVSWWSSEDEVNRNSYSELESSLDEMTELILADSETSIQSSSHTCPDDAHSSSSGYYHESRPLSIIEESEPPLEAAPAAAPSNIIVGNPAAETRVCSTGMMRCTDDKRGFDTCLYGKWGTVRTCAQGTTCMAVAGDSIACGLE
ncbi:hypothetical protein LPJ63_003450 [Coemansia sp. RSA 2711]|nr:hypothetical protein LPJ63_003450 [Coemansia sp. RSA 2711]KAJ2307677.1 hypothetical protein IWW54_004315 [Coemansia sp. RSA 2705]